MSYSRILKTWNGTSHPNSGMEEQPLGRRRVAPSLLGHRLALQFDLEVDGEDLLDD